MDSLPTHDAPVAPERPAVTVRTLLSVAFSRRSGGTALRLAALAGAGLVASVLLSAPHAEAVESVAPRAVVLEADSGSMLYARGADETFAPANFTKLMTAAVVFDALKAGEIRDDTVFTVSNNAWRTGGAPARVTTMFAKVNSRVAVSDLLKGLVVHYANDAAIALAEGLSGNETAFAQRMNETAERLGMKRSRFANATGFPDKRARISLSDLSVLVGYIQTQHADHYALYGLQDFEWNKIRQTNKTVFVRDVSGADGLMLAFDENARFGAVVSAVRDGKRVTVAGSGYRTGAERDKDIRALLDTTFQEFSTVTLFAADEPVGSVRVFGGTRTRVPVTGEGLIRVTLPNGVRNQFRARIAYEGPVAAPVERGQRVARLEITLQDRVYQSIPLVAAEDVPVGGLTERARDGFAELLLGWW